MVEEFTAFGLAYAFGMTAITALTAQNTTRVYGIVEIEPSFVVKQIEACVSDIGCDAVKTRLPSGTAIIEAVTDAISRHKLAPLVVDPVMIAKSGASLLRPDAIAALKSKLLPLAVVVTPNHRFLTSSACNRSCGEDRGATRYPPALLPLSESCRR